MPEISVLVSRVLPRRDERRHAAAAIGLVVIYLLALLFFSLRDVPMDRVFLARRDAVRIALATAHPLQLNMIVPVSDHRHAAHGLAFLAGWSGIESWGVWSERKKASLCLVVPPGTPGPLRLTLHALIFLKPHHLQSLQVYANGTILGAWTLNRPNAVLQMALPPAKSGRYDLLFVIKHPGKVPGGDPRKLGIGLVALQVQSPKPPP